MDVKSNYLGHESLPASSSQSAHSPLTSFINEEFQPQNFHTILCASEFLIPVPPPDTDKQDTVKSIKFALHHVMHCTDRILIYRCSY